MGWVRIGGWAVPAVLLLPGVAGAQRDAWQQYQGLGSTGQAGVDVALTLFVGVVVLGLFPGWGPKAMATARRSPILSGAVGIPATIALVVLSLVGAVLAATAVGIAFGIPLVVASLGILLAWRTVGYVALGAFVAGRFGYDNRWVGLLVGTVIVGATSLVPAGLEIVGAGSLSLPLVILAVALEAIVVFVGVGAGIRASLGGGGDPGRERNVPPAHQV